MSFCDHSPWDQCQRVMCLCRMENTSLFLSGRWVAGGRGLSWRHHTGTAPAHNQDVSHHIKFIDPCASIKLKRSLIQKRIFWTDPMLSNSSKCTCKNEWLRNWNAKHFSERWPEIGSENWNKAQTAALSIYLLILDMRKSLCLWETFWIFFL